MCTHFIAIYVCKCLNLYAAIKYSVCTLAYNAQITWVIGISQAFMANILKKRFRTTPYISTFKLKKK